LWGGLGNVSMRVIIIIKTVAFDYHDNQKRFLSSDRPRRGGAAGSCMN